MARKTLQLIRRAISAAIVAGSAGFAGSANAIVFIGNWDPLFNPNFDADFAWRGRSTVDVDPACLAPGNWGTILTVGSLACPVANLIKAELQFYDNDFGTPGTFFPDMGWLGSFALTRVAISGTGGVEAIETTAPPASLFSFTHSLFAGAWFPDLDFVLGATLADPFGPQLTLTEDLGGAIAGPVELAIAIDPCISGSPRVCKSALTGDNAPTPIRWTAVPEPGPLALLGAALGAFGWSRRRRA